MKNSKKFFVPLFAFIAFSALAQNASITADFALTQTEVSKNLFGIFYEDINYAADGGLYGEMVQNRSFEAAAGGFPFSLGWKDHINIFKETSFGHLEKASKDGLNENNPTYVRFFAKEAGDGFSNAGYGGMFFEGGKTYSGSVYLRSSEVKSLMVTIGDESKTVISGITNEWKKFDFALTSTITTRTGSLAFYADTAGVIDVDFVSLFTADIYKNEPNGLRKDLAEMIENMHPAFVRFPGGCIVHGHKLNDRYQWKNTIGKVEERKENINFWSNPSTPYMQSYGLGFYEYFRFCEDIGAEPIPVLSCGMSHDGEISSINEYKQYAEDALDLIEYATGAAKSKWGKKRAEAGHPEPFKLNYIAIGNEDWGQDYFERYKYIASAITKKYPNIKPIISSGWTYKGEAWFNTWKQIRTWQQNKKTSKIAGLVDEHYYNPYAWFLTNVKRYDDKDFFKRGKKEPKVFIGEYASWVDGRRNNLFAALTEAAFMTGIERNGDIVEIASYAPLFAREGFVQWAPDAIWFNNSQVYGTPNYYVQSLFMNHKCDYTVQSELLQPISSAEKKFIGGTVALGSWATNVEFKDIKVTNDDTNQILYTSQGETNLESFKSENRLGEWNIENGVIVQKSNATPAFMALDNEADIENVSNYTLELKAKKTSGAEGFLISFGVKGNSVYWWNLGGWGNKQNAIEKGEIRGGKSQYDFKPYSLESGKWYNIKIVVHGENVKCYLEGKLLQEMNDVLNYEPLYSHVGRTKDGKVIIKIVNVSEKEVSVDINLKNAPRLAPNAKVTIMTGEKEAENTFASPKNISPIEKSFEGVSSTFTYPAPAYSISILEIE